jgi:hypothetical protein
MLRPGHSESCLIKKLCWVELGNSIMVFESGYPRTVMQAARKAEPEVMQGRSLMHLFSFVPNAVYHTEELGRDKHLSH